MTVITEQNEVGTLSFDKTRIFIFLATPIRSIITNVKHA